jgi:hypothetical protein
MQGPILVTADSAYEPRFKQDAETLTVVYISKDSPDAFANPYSQTKMRKVLNGKPLEEEIIFSHGGYAGGMSYDNRFLSAGFTRAAMIDLKSGKTTPDTLHKLMLQQGSSKAAEYLQVCNPSVSASRIFTRCMMYIDIGSFGKTNPLINRNEPWEAHNIIYITNMSDSIVKYFFKPPGTDIPDRGSLTGYQWRWDDPEWSNHPYYATSAVQCERRVGASVAYDYHEHIYLINLKDSAYLKVVESTNTGGSSNTDMMWPWFWVKIPDDFKEDPLWLCKANYNSEASTDPWVTQRNRPILRGALPDYGMKSASMYTILGAYAGIAGDSGPGRAAGVSGIFIEAPETPVPSHATLRLSRPAHTL